jgi:hypothetical protein
MPEASPKVPYYRAPRLADDPFVGVAHMVADAIITIGGPLFWGVLGIGLLTSLLR